MLHAAQRAADLSDSVVLEPEVNQRRVLREHLPELQRALQSTGTTAHICAGTGLTPATSALGLGSPLPHLQRDWAHPCHICNGPELTLPHLARAWAQLLPKSAP